MKIAGGIERNYIYDFYYVGNNSAKNRWIQFAFDNISLLRQQDLYDVISLRLQVDYSSVGDRTYNICNDSVAVKNVLQALVDIQYQSPSKAKARTAIECHGHIWHIFYRLSYPFICVDCLNQRYQIPADPVLEERKTQYHPPSNDEESIISYDHLLSSSYFLLKANVRQISTLPKFSIQKSATVRTAVRLTITMTSPGHLSCAAFTLPMSPSNLSLHLIRSLGSSGSTALISAPPVSPSNEYYVRLTLSGLLPDTSYTVYCAASDLRRVSSTHPSDIFSHALAVRTKCCQGIVFDVKHSHVLSRDLHDEVSSVASEESRQAGVSEWPFHFRLDAPPKERTLIKIAMTSSSSCPSTRSLWGDAEATRRNSTSRDSGAVTVPSIFAFDSSSRDFTGSFVVRSPVGCFLLRAFVLAGTPYVENVLPVMVVKNVATMPAPSMQYARFSDDANYILVGFNSYTNRAAHELGELSYTSFSCDLIFNFTSAQEFVCSWLSSTLIRIDLPIHIHMNVSMRDTMKLGSVISLLGGKLLSACFSYERGDEYLRAGSLHSECPNVFAAPKSLLVGRAVSPQSPRVILKGPKSVSVCEDLTLDPTESSGHGGRRWDHIEWVVSSSYSDRIVSEHLNISEYLNRHFPDTRTPAVIPSSMLRPSVLTFSLHVSNFIGGALVSSVTVSLLGGASRVISVELDSTSLVSAYRWQRIKIRALPYVHDCSKINNTTEDEQYVLTCVWRVYVGEEFHPEIVSISSIPCVFELAPYSLAHSKEYTVQVTAFAPDVPELTSAVASVILSIERSSIVAHITGNSKGAYSSSVDHTIDASSSRDPDVSPHAVSSSTLLFSWSCVVLSAKIAVNFRGSSCGLELPRAASILIPAGSLRTDVYYRFTVSVSSTDGQYSTKALTIHYVQSYVPLVYVDSTTSKYNADERVFIDGYVKPLSLKRLPDLSGIEMDWFCVSNNSLAPMLSMNILPADIRGDDPQSISFPLIVAPRTFMPHMDYSFQLRVSIYTSNNILYFQSMYGVSIHVNSPPLGGRLSISPSTGVSLQSAFQFIALDWVDDVSDYPLQYTMLVSIGSNGSRDINHEEWSVVRNKYALATASSIYLGEGARTVAYRVPCAVVVEDLFGGRTSSSAAVSVTPPESGYMTKDATLILRMDLRVAMNRYDIDRVMQLIAGSMSLLARVSVLDTTATTTWRYVRCLREGAGISCETRGGHNDGVQTSVPHSTQAKSAGCPSNCFYRGRCVRTIKAYDYDGSAVSVFQCDCWPGYYGADCSMSHNDFIDKVSRLELLCSGLLYAAQHQVDGNHRSVWQILSLILIVHIF